jgi:hypothetical protein
MSTDFNDELNTQLASETKLTLASGKVANFAYDSDAYADDIVAGVADYDYDNHQNIPLGDATTLNTDSSILNKGVRSQASSLTRMMLNHFFGRTSFNVNKLSDHVKNLLTTVKNFIKEGSNEWSPTVIYEAGDVVYYISELNHEPCKRTFKCIADCPTDNLPPIYTDGSLINTTYWKELSGRVISLTVGNANSGQANVATFNGSITVSGNITQSGTPYETHAEQIYTKKDNIITREDATGALPSNSYSGLKIFNYDGNGTNGILAYRSDGTAVVGDEAGTPVVETLQPLLTRAEEGSPQLVNGGILVWNSVTKRAETTTLAGVVTLNVTANITIENYNTDVMLKVTAPNVTITMGALAEFAEVTFFAQYDTIISFNGITDTLLAYENCKLQYIAGTWYVTSNESAGDVKGNATDTKPFGTLLCNGDVLTGTDETSYPRLWHALTVDDGQGGTTGKYNLPSDPATVRRLPDFRECVLVGAGESTRADIASHDVYSVGEFKDDQMQGHWHKGLPYQSSGTYDSLSVTSHWSSSDAIPNRVGATDIVQDRTNGTPRVGSTTHGKQIGINYIIKY